MKFISKSSNLLIVLKPGMSAQPLTGTPAVPTVSVRFKDGMADVQSQELTDLMLAHPGFNGDFISAEAVPTDPFASMRQQAEPTHVLTEMKFGTPVARSTKGPAANLSPEIMKLVQQMASQMATEMLPGMVENTIKQIVSTKKAETAEDVVVPDEIVSEEPTEVVEEAPKAKATTKARAK